MTKSGLFELAARLERSGVSFVIATVVRRAGLSSAHQGDMAIVTADGAFHGWIGGGCTRHTVEQEAARALAEARPRFINLSPEPEREARPGVLTLPMTCHSGGTVEVYLDPIVATPRLVLYGHSPVIVALCALARAIGYRVDVVSPDARADEFPQADRVLTALGAPELSAASSDERPWVVVASMGELDDEAVLAALAMRPAYLGVVASRRRFAILRQALETRGVDADALARIENPAGLDLGARVSGEVAVSILAQIVARRNGVGEVREGAASDGAARTTDAEITAARTPRASGEARQSLMALASRTTPPAPSSVAESLPPGEATDPICGMRVTIVGARHATTWDGREWYFCCGGCKTRFLANPTQYAGAVPTASEG